METHFEILIDASGSMGFMKGTKDEDQFLLPDGKSTRTDLVKKILINNVIPKLSFLESKVLKIKTFRTSDGFKESIIFWDKFNIESVIPNINNKIINPEIGGTPLFTAIEKSIIGFKNYKNTLIVLSDGDANDEENFDEKIIKLIKENNFNCTIYFIGIDQNAEAENKSRRLAVYTKGAYVNVKAINYDKSQFDNFLFDINTSIIKDTITTSVRQNSPEIQGKPLTDKPIDLKAEIDSNAIDETVNERQTETEVENIDSEIDSEIKDPIAQITESEEVILKLESLAKLEQEVTNNSNSISGISAQLETLVNQIRYLNKNIRSNIDDDDAYLDSDIYEAENKITGRRCEEYLYAELLKKKWDKVDWVNKDGEQGKPYDFEIIHKGVRYYVECKGTKGNSNEFSITKKEWLFYLDYKPNYRLYFVSNLDSKEPNVQKFDDLITAFENQDLIPFSAIDRKVKADKFWIQVDNRKSEW